jgi:hypothetical protein
MSLSASGTWISVGATTLIVRYQEYVSLDAWLSPIKRRRPGKVYAHSVFNRVDGDHVSIWIDNSFTPGEVNERETDAAVEFAGMIWSQARPLRGLITCGCSDCCGESTFDSCTDGNAPFTGDYALEYCSL